MFRQYSMENVNVASPKNQVGRRLFFKVNKTNYKIPYLHTYLYLSLNRLPIKRS